MYMDIHDNHGWDISLSVYLKCCLSGVSIESIPV